jgi:rfaE bifunctional protein kinase chain/domain
VKERLVDLIKHFSKSKILVLGDFIVDEFVFGEISRVSREAPVLILRHKGASACPGGAANTVANASALGAEVIPLGMIGDDTWADTLVSLWPKSVIHDFVFRNSEFRTTRKSRILAGSSHSFRQQVVRLDYEYGIKLSRKEENTLISSLEELLPSVEVLVVSDYSLGNLTERVRTEAIRMAATHSVSVVVDSRDDPSGYPGATTVTPNITEVEATVGHTVGRSIEEMEKTCMDARVKWKAEALLVTRGKFGMSLFSKDGAIHISAFGTDEVVDVTGAGDTVAATYATGLAAGASFEEAARLANYAGGLVVMKKGTATVSSSELRAAIAAEH